jgi:exonuclease SbcD
VPTFQREWGKRIMRLSRAGIPTLMLVGNHDLSPAAGRAHAIQEFETLEIPYIHVASRPLFLKPEQLNGVPVQVIAIPWVSRSSMMAALELSGTDPGEVYSELGARLSELVSRWLDEVDPNLPVILTAHASVQGALFGGERTVMLGSDLVLPGSMVKDPRLSYVALGHIHKPQDVNQGVQPPVIYPGSIERVDFGEAADDKFYVIATVEKGQPTTVEWVKLNGRRFIDRSVALDPSSVELVGDLPTIESCMSRIYRVMPTKDDLSGSILRLTIDYPRNWEEFIDEADLRRYCESAFEFHLIRRPQVETRLRIPSDHTISSLTPVDLLNIYWKTQNVSSENAAYLTRLAQEVFGDAGDSEPTDN